MEQEDRTVPATEKRRKQAREQGLGPRSQELSLACRLLGIALAFQFCGSGLATDLADLVSSQFQRADFRQFTIETTVASILQMVTRVAWNLAGFLGLVFSTSLLARFAQVGFRFDFGRLIPDMERINPGTGASKILNPENGLAALMTCLKLTVWCAVIGWFVTSQLATFVILMECDVGEGARQLGRLLISLTWLLAGTQLLIGVGDYGWQYWKFEQSLKMSPDELREER